MSTTEAAASPEGDAARADLRPHLDRELADSGLRVSRLTCLSGGGPGVSMTVIGAWRAAVGECASLFCVGDGSRLAGTTVLMRERPLERAALWIWLPTSKAVRRLNSAQIDDHVLGSDFVYDDFRVWTPRLLAETTACAGSDGDGAGTLTLRGEYAWRGMSPLRVEAELDLASGLVRSGRWVMPGSSTPLRTFAASGIETIEGTATPGTLTVIRPTEGYESRVQLLGQSSRVPFEHLSFLPADLPSVGRELTAVAEGLATRAS